MNKILEMHSPTSTNSIWRSLLHHWFQDCLTCCWPNISSKIDWNQPAETLAHPVQAVILSQQTEARMIPTLHQVSLLSGERCLIALYWVTQTLEVHSLLPQLFKAACKIYNHYDQPALTLVILADDTGRNIPTTYPLSILEYPTYLFHFQSVQLQDWHDESNQLLISHNGFEVILSLYLQTRHLAQDAGARYKTKIKLYSDLLEKTQRKHDLFNFYTFIDSMIPLPEPLEKRCHAAIRALERQKQVDYVTNAEKFGQDTGFKAGFQAGIEYANRDHLKTLILEGIDRTVIKTVLQLNDRELNRLMILENFDAL